MKEQVIEILKNSKQELVFLNALITPVRDLVGRSPGDNVMKNILDELIGDGVIEDYLGFWTYGNPGYLYATSCTLTDHFFTTYCRPRMMAGRQLNLFA